MNDTNCLKFKKIMKSDSDDDIFNWIKDCDCDNCNLLIEKIKLINITLNLIPEEEKILKRFHPKLKNNRLIQSYYFNLLRKKKILKMLNKNFDDLIKLFWVKKAIIFIEQK